jgi:hypothetical protein
MELDSAIQAKKATTKVNNLVAAIFNAIHP